MFLAFVFTLAVTAGPDPDRAAFETLKGMAGDWRDTLNPERPMQVSYRTIANDSAVVETWRTPSGRETLTLYVMDGDTLIATHYCAQGNQPTLELVSADNGLRFAFRSATNLSDPSRSHQHAFNILMLGNGHVVHDETYVEDAESETTRYEFVRER